MNRGSLFFSLFGIPIEIKPLSWLLLAFLGGAFRIQGADDVAPVLVFMFAAMASLIAHELGHALAGRHLLGAVPSITLHAFGGETQNAGIRDMSRSKYFMMVLAGPLAGLLPALLAFVLLAAQLGDWSACWSFAQFSALPVVLSVEQRDGLQLVSEFFADPASGRMSVMFELYYAFFFIGAWWTFLNLLPIFPLDGGKLVATLLNNYKISALIGIVFSFLFLAFALWVQSVYSSIFACYFVYLNWQHFQMYRKMRG